MVDIPVYPEFKLISGEDLTIFNSFSKFTFYSDFNLLSLLSWNVHKTNAFSILDNNLVLKVKDYLTEDYNYSIAGENNLVNAIEALVDAVGTLKFVPDIVATAVKDQFNLTEDRDNFDYILSTSKVTKLIGNEMKALRHNINSFEKENPKYELRLLDHKDVSVKQKILDLTKMWVEQKKFDNEKLEEEVSITQNFFHHSKLFNCNLLGLYVNDILISYTFNELISQNMVMGHFGKSLNGYTCAAHFTEYMTAKYYFDKGFEYINQEQDAGLQGLRSYKESFKPVSFLKKFIVTKN